MSPEKSRSRLPRADWSKATYSCVVKAFGEPRATPHEKRHREGCRRVAPCGCEQRYYSTYYNRPSDAGWKSQGRTVDRRCNAHFEDHLRRLKEARA